MALPVELAQLLAELEPKIKTALSSGKWYEKVGKIVETVVPVVEEIGVEFSGADKKKFAMELIETIYFQYLDNKYIPNFIEQIIVRNLSSFAIDKIVALLNKTGVFKHKTT